jgi:hypothetical protein
MKPPTEARSHQWKTGPDKEKECGANYDWSAVARLLDHSGFLRAKEKRNVTGTSGSVPQEP